MPVFQIADMTCKHCEATITKTVKDIDAQAQVIIDLAAHTAKIESQHNIDVIEKAISDAGFTPVRQA